MPEYGKITRDLQDTGERREFLEPPADEAEIAPYKPYWVPIEYTVIDNSVDDDTVMTEQKEVEATRILYTKFIRSKSAQEKEGDDTVKIESQFAEGSAERALATALFQVINEVRTLNNQTPITVQQYKDYLKSLLR